MPDEVQLSLKPDVREVLISLNSLQVNQSFVCVSSTVGPTNTTTPRSAASNATSSRPALDSWLNWIPLTSVPMRGVMFVTFTPGPPRRWGFERSARVPGSSASKGGTSIVGVNPSGLVGRYVGYNGSFTVLVDAAMTAVGRYLDKTSALSKLSG